MKFIFALAAGLACMASVCEAAVVNLTVHGRISDITFETRPGAGDAFFAVVPIGTAYRFDYSYDTSTPPTSVAGRGLEAFYANPLLSSVLTIGSNSFIIDPTMDFNTVAVYRNGGSNFPRYSVSTNLFSGSVLIDGFRGIDFGVALFDTRRLASPAAGLPSAVNVADYDTQDARVRLSKFGVGEIGVGLTINRIVSGGAAVPEASTWAMLIAGFGLVGVSLRRRRTGRLIAA